MVDTRHGSFVPKSGRTLITKRALLIRLILVCLAVAVASTTGIAQSGSRSDRTRQRVQQALAAGTELRPDPDTDEVAEVRLVSDRTGRGFRVHRKIDTSARRASQATFWAIDTLNGTYRAFRVTDPASDAVRIGQHLQRNGVAVKTEQLAERLRKGNERFEMRKQRFERMRSTPPPVQARRRPELVGLVARNGGGAFAEEDGGLALAQEYCNFWVSAVIEAWEPGAYLGALHLTETTSATFVTNTFGSWIIQQSGDCWANSDTFINTTWDVVYCGEEEWSNTVEQFEFSNNHYGEYVNWDFGHQQISTSIWQQAALTFNSSGLSHTLYHWDGGEGSSLIQGQEFYDYAVNGCPGFPVF